MQFYFKSIKFESRKNDEMNEWKIKNEWNLKN